MQSLHNFRQNVIKFNSTLSLNAKYILLTTSYCSTRKLIKLNSAKVINRDITMCTNKSESASESASANVNMSVSSNEKLESIPMFLCDKCIIWILSTIFAMYIWPFCLYKDIKDVEMSIRKYKLYQEIEPIEYLFF